MNSASEHASPGSVSTCTENMLSDCGSHAGNKLHGHIPLDRNMTSPNIKHPGRVLRPKHSDKDNQSRKGGENGTVIALDSGLCKCTT